MKRIIRGERRETFCIVLLPYIYTTTHKRLIAGNKSDQFAVLQCTEALLSSLLPTNFMAHPRKVTSCSIKIIRHIIYIFGKCFMCELLTFEHQINDILVHKCIYLHCCSPINSNPIRSHPIRFESIRFVIECNYPVFVMLA